MEGPPEPAVTQGLRAVPVLQSTKSFLSAWRGRGGDASLERPKPLLRIEHSLNLNPSNPQTLNPSNPQSLNPSIPRTLNPQTLKPSIPQTLNPSIPQSLEP